jgi:elongation factor 1-gamma
MKLLGSVVSPRNRKIEIASYYANVDLTFEGVLPRNLSDDELKEFKKKNPNAKVPVLETPDGPLFESGAILRYIARLSKDHKLYGSTKFEEGLVDQYVDWATTLFEPSFYGWAGPYFGHAPYNHDTHPAARDKYHKALKILDDRLQHHEYLVGSHVTIADIQVCVILTYTYRYLSDSTFRHHFPHVTKYIRNVGNQEPFKRAFGRYIESNTPLDPYTGPLPQPEEAKKPEAKPKAQPKKEEKPAQQPKKKEQKKKDEDDDDDEPKEKKEKNPLDDLPPSPFNLYDFKTLFVNAPSKKEALQTFFQQLDPEGYSVWHMQYDKAEGEGQVVFLTANLMNGYLQRLETFRKYSLGVVGVYGEEPNLEIRGVWVWRGNEVPFELKDHPSGEWYKFSKMDVKNNEADKKRIEEYWCGWDEDESIVDGLRARIVKYYK